MIDRYLHKYFQTEVGLQCISHCIALHCICIALPLRCIALHGVALHCMALRDICVACVIHIIYRYICEGGRCIHSTGYTIGCTEADPLAARATIAAHGLPAHRLLARPLPSCLARMHSVLFTARKYRKYLPPTPPRQSRPRDHRRPPTECLPGKVPRSSQLEQKIVWA